MENQQIPTIKPKLTKLDWYLMFAWLLILISSILVLSYYFLNNVNQCTSDPLSYSIKSIKESTGLSLLYGTITGMNDKGQRFVENFGDVNLTEDRFNFSLD